MKLEFQLHNNEKQKNTFTFFELNLRAWIFIQAIFLIGYSAHLFRNNRRDSSDS
jgi:hypothetical protein